MSPRSLALLGCLATLLPATPSHAGVLAVGATTTWTAYDNASICFTLRTGVLIVGTATATGAVSTGPVIPPNSVTPVVDGVADALGIGVTLATTLPARVVADVRPLASTSGYASVCVGGAGANATGGMMVFSVDAHSATADWVTVVTCSYTPFAGADCG